MTGQNALTNKTLRFDEVQLPILVIAIQGLLLLLLVIMSNSD
jgi:hypothetical protein